MQHCDLQSGLGRMQRSAAKFKEQWLDIKQVWKDKAAQDFEKDVLQMLAPQITLAAAAVHELADLLTQAEKELEDHTSDY